MDDNNKTIKYDLRETRFSQNYQHSIELYQKQDLDCNFDNLKTTLGSQEIFHLRNRSNGNLLIQEDQSMIYSQETIAVEGDMLWGINQQEEGHKQMVYMEFGKGFEYQQNLLNQKRSTSLFGTPNYTRQSSTQHTTQKSQQNSDSSDSQQVFSQKLSLIRSLQQKLSSLHQKIKLPASSSNTYLEECKISLQKQYQIYTQSTMIEKLDKQNSSTNQSSPGNDLSQISQAHSQRKSFAKNCANDSIQSESMLLDRDFDLYCQRKIPTTKIIGRSMSDRPEVQFIETIRIVEVPYLIEVNKQIEEKIVWKKSFYFEQNQDIHKTFEEFTQKQAQHQSMINIEKRLKHDTSLNDLQANHDLSKSITNHNPHLYIPQQNYHQQTSVLSVLQQSNRTFHNGIKQKRDDISFNYDENSNQILSKLQTKNNQSEIEQLQEKVKSLEIQNSQLKQKVKEFIAHKQQSEIERCQLAQQLIRLSQCEQFYSTKLNKYKQKLINIQQEFAQILQNQQTQLKTHYQTQIQQFQTEQSQYANRIISFEQLFQQQKGKQEKFTELIDTQQQHIIDLQKLCKEKDSQTECEIFKRRQLEEYIVQKENEFKRIIQKLQKDNIDLKHLMREIHLRYQSQGFYILNEEAHQLKKTLQEKDILHVEELDKLQNRYSHLIEKYQLQLQAMKRGLQKVRLNKSNSFSNLNNYTNPQIVHYYPSINRRISPVKKRQSIMFSKISRTMQYSEFNNESISEKKEFSQLKQFIVNEDKQILGYEKRYEKDISVSHFSQNSFSLNKSQSSSLYLTPSQLDHSQQLLIYQLQTLRQQNTTLQQTLSSQRKQKTQLSKKLSNINSTMSKYMNEINCTEEQQQKHEETFMNCVNQLEKQYLINKKLKQKLTQFQSQKKHQNNNSNLSSNDNSNQTTVSINEEQVKVHPIFIQLSKQYKCSKKYIKLLEKQLKDLVKLNCEVQPTKNFKQKTPSKDNIIEELKTIGRGNV